MLSAIAHQTGRSEEGRDIAYTWSYKSSKHTGDTGDEEFRKTWESLEKPRKGRPITAKYIVQWAKYFNDKNDNRPTITINAGHLHVAATEAEQALLKYDAPLYIQGPRIVRPVVEEVEASKDERQKQPA